MLDPTVYPPAVWTIEAKENADEIWRKRGIVKSLDEMVYPKEDDNEWIKRRTQYNGYTPRDFDPNKEPQDVAPWAAIPLFLVVAIGIPLALGTMGVSGDTVGILLSPVILISAVLVAASFD